MNQQQKLHERMIRVLESKPMTEGALANYVRLTLQDPAFREALEYLSSSGLVKIEPRPWGNARVVTIMNIDPRVKPCL
jgi:predicted ArsR family transcriptional regulator